MNPLQFKPDARFLLVRTDKIGDLLLTTPAVAALRRAYPAAHIGFVASPYAAPLLENNPDVNRIYALGEPGLQAKLRQARFDAAIHFYAEPKSIWASFRAGIPVRIGPFSKIASIFLTHRVRQNRSAVEKHEAEYNYDLVKLCGARELPKRPFLYLSEAEMKRGFDMVSLVLNQLSVKPFVIHPGSAGSAKNWPLENYLELAGRIAKKFGNVLFTAGPDEKKVIEAARALKNPAIYSIAAGGLKLRDMAAVLSQARLVVSNSTGPLHMAVALGVPTCSFYPQLPVVTSPKRWGPFGEPARNVVLSPNPPEAPMASITVDQAMDAVEKLYRATE